MPVIMQHGGACTITPTANLFAFNRPHVRFWQRPRLLSAALSAPDDCPAVGTWRVGKRVPRTVVRASSDVLVETERNLVVAIDSSEDSKYACQWLLDNVYRKGDHVHVLHCLPHNLPASVYVMPDGRLASPELDSLGSQNTVLAEAQRAVSRWCDLLLATAQVPYEVDLLQEQPPGPESADTVGATICTRAKELQASVLVIATHARAGLSEFLLGSVASYCAHHCESPVLVLHRPKEEGPRQGLQGISSLASLLSNPLDPTQHSQGGEAGAADRTESGEEARGRHIVLAVDDSDASERACLWAARNLYRRGDTVHLTHIIPAAPCRATSMDGYILYFELPNENVKLAIEEFVSRRFVSKLQALGIEPLVEIITERRAEGSVSEIGDAICKRVAALGGPAVVVVGSHMRGGLAEFMLGSLAAHLTHHCPQPVAVLH